MDKTKPTLNDQDNLLRSLIDALPGEIYIKDTFGRLLFANAGKQRRLGVASPEQLVGKTDYDFMPKDAAGLHHREDMEIMQTGKPLLNPAANSDAMPSESRSCVSKFPLRNSAGEIIGLVGISIEAPEPGPTEVELGTKLRETEEELRLKEEQFRQAQKLEAVGSLAGGIAHDFNNMLTIILGQCDLILGQGRDEQALRKSIVEIKKAAQRSASMTKQLLAFSRKQMLEPRVMDLNTLLTDISPMIRRLIGADIEFSVRPTSSLGSIKVDPGQIQHVILNLVVNARDAMPNGGRLVIETENVELGEDYVGRRRVVRPGSYARMTVSDTGVGMNAEVQERIFEPFYTTKKRGEGTGLGLSTVYGVIKQSGGYIWVYSEPDRGTSFKIYFPRTGETAWATTPTGMSGAAAVKTAPRTVLLAEDEKGIRELAAMVLRGQGHTVLAAKDGVEALALCKSHEGPIDLLVTDVVMPRMGGPELAGRLTEIYPEVKILYISGYTDALVRHGVLGQESPFLEKPFTVSTLLGKVVEVMHVA